MTKFRSAHKALQEAFIKRDTFEDWVAEISKIAIKYNLRFQQQEIRLQFAGYRKKQPPKGEVYEYAKQWLNRAM